MTTDNTIQATASHSALQVIKASAGSGKTYTLAKTYIEQLLWRTDPETGASHLRVKERNYHEHILAITFTNKATDEMKQRIVKELYLLWKSDKSDYLKDFLKTHAESEEQIREAAGKALKEILFGYVHFHVSTIDSFFQTVLRTFARELDCDYDYELQIDEDYATRSAVHSFMTMLGKPTQNEYIDKWVKDLIKEEVVNKGDWDFFGKSAFSRLMEFAKTMNKESFITHRGELLGYLEHKGPGLSAIQQFKKALVEAARRNQDAYVGKSGTGLSPDDFIALLSSHGLSVDDIKSRSALNRLLEERDPEAKPNDTLMKYSVDDIGSKGFKADVTLSACEDVIAFRDKVIQAHGRWKNLEKLVDDIWQLGMLAIVDRHLEEFRKENNALLISDTNELIGRVLEAGVPFMYERVGTWLNHFMIDEFQDTSRKQYKNFKPLLKESLGEGYSNLIIGDEKQSIYRFRNSDSDLLRVELSNDFKGYYDDSHPLEVNYRSFENIVKFNNLFFEQLIKDYVSQNSKYVKLQDTYAHLKQKYSGSYDKTGLKGYVRVNFVHKKKKQSDETDKGTTSGSIEKLPQYLVDLHQKQGIPYRDMLILVNVRKDGNKVIEQLLKHNQNAAPGDVIDVISGESLLLKNSPAVRLVVSVLRLIDSTLYAPNEDDADDHMGDRNTERQESYQRAKRLATQYQYKALHNFVNQLTDHQVKDYGEALAQSFEKFAKDRERPEEEQMKLFADELADLLPDPQNEMMCLVTLVEKIINKYVLQGDITNADGADESDKERTKKIAGESTFLMAFQNCVLEFTQQPRSGGTVHEFLRYWDDKSDVLAVPSTEAGEALNVMTIHAAKGLERNCVIIPFANWDMVKHDKLSWIPREVWMNGNDPVEGIGKDNEAIVPPLIPVSSNLLELFNQFDDYHAASTQEHLIDNINKTYVAFTRPRQHLHIFYDLQRESIDVPQNVGEWLYCIMPKLPEVKCYALNETNNDPVPCANNDKNLACCELGECEVGYQKPNDNDQIPAAEHDMPPYFVKSALPLLKVLLPKDETTQQIEGTRLHRVFSMIDRPGDEVQALRYARQTGIVDGENAWTSEMLQQVFDRMFTDPRTAPWFDPENKVLNERTIISATRLSFDKRRPDRVVMRPNGEVLVIDYKFGQKYSPQVIKKNRKQVADYVRLLNSMGHMQIRGFLWYVASDSVLEV